MVDMHAELWKLLYSSITQEKVNEQKRERDIKNIVLI